MDGDICRAPAQATWLQAVQLIREHIVTGVTQSVDDAVPNVDATSTVTGTGVSEARVIKRGSVHERLLELLEIDDLGIRGNRRNKFLTDFSNSNTH